MYKGNIFTRNERKVKSTTLNSTLQMSHTSPFPPFLFWEAYHRLFHTPPQSFLFYCNLHPLPTPTPCKLHLNSVCIYNAQIALNMNAESILMSVALITLLKCSDCFSHKGNDVDDGQCHWRQFDGVAKFSTTYKKTVIKLSFQKN